jgi:hypothetical protein
MVVEFSLDINESLQNGSLWSELHKSYKSLSNPLIL